MRILLSTDGSEPSEAALRQASIWPWPEGSTLRVLTVVQLQLPVTPFFVEVADNYERVLSQWREDAQRLVVRSAELLRRPGLVVETRVREGDPRSEIIDEARAWGADLIVLGSHGRTGMERVLMGSVAEHVVRHAGCSVEVVRLRHEAPRQERHAAAPMRR